MNAGRFRSDLFFRIAQVRVELPALRERTGDMPMLVEESARRGSRRHRPDGPRWIEQRIGAHDWPGNVRELVNVASVASTLADTPEAIDDVLTLARADGDPASVRQAATAFSEAKRSAVAPSSATTSWPSRAARRGT